VHAELENQSERERVQTTRTTRTSAAASERGAEGHVDHGERDGERTAVHLGVQDVLLLYVDDHRELKLIQMPTYAYTTAART
jgi:hypothetical protein